MIISVFIPHGGCPERCSFCDQKVSGGEPLSKNAVSKTIVEHLQTKLDPAPVSVAFYGGTFTALPQRLQLNYLEAVKPFLDSGQVQGVRISTRPDAIDADWLLRLKNEFALQTVELGVQTFNPASLLALGRSHSVESVYKACLVLQKLDLEVGLHMMLGCPQEGDAMDADALTLRHLQALNPDFVRIHPLLVLESTPLAGLYEKGLFQPLGLENAVLRAARLTEALTGQGIAVRRLGLQPNELLKTAVIAGAYHSAFGELVRSRILLEKLQGLFDQEGVLPDSILQLFVAEQWASRVRGQRSQNVQILREKYLFSDVQFHQARVKETHLEVRFFNAVGASQCREIQLAQQVSRRRASNCNAQSANHLDVDARLSSPPGP